MDKLLRQVQDTISAYHMLQDGEAVLVGLSGGADSVALTLALQRLGYAVRAFHLHHGLRGAEADRDAAFCQDFCAKQGISLEMQRVDAAAFAAESRQSVETAARQLRYACFARAAHGDTIATAHNANDNLETMLFHLVRGTGLAGMAGIPPVRDRIIRPLIACSRAEIEAFLQKNGHSFVTDSTNLQDNYTRNRIRHTVLPALLEVNERAVENAYGLSCRVRQDDAYLEAQAGELLAKAQVQGAYRAPVLRDAPIAVRTRVLRHLCGIEQVQISELRARHLEALERLLQGEHPSAKTDLPGGIRAQRQYDLLVFGKTPEQAPEKPVQTVRVTGAGVFGQPGFGVTLRQVEKNQVFYKSFNTFYAGCDTIDLSTCVLRVRQTGDRLRLHPNSGSKTLKKFMIEKKIPSGRRDRLAVLADQNGVIAVQGLGVDVRCQTQGEPVWEIRFEG